jgi:hypothetical protein
VRRKSGVSRQCEVDCIRWLDHGKRYTTALMTWHVAVTGRDSTVGLEGCPVAIVGPERVRTCTS